MDSWGCILRMASFLALVDEVPYPMCEENVNVSQSTGPELLRYPFAVVILRGKNALWVREYPSCSL